MRSIIRLLCVLALLASPSIALAQFGCQPFDRLHPDCPRMNPSNGHWYATGAWLPDAEFATWEGARISAESLEFMGMRGYLATITAESENTFINELVLGDGGTAWFGASDKDVEGEWRWMTGPEAGELFWLGDGGGQAFGYNNWEPGEPNAFANENYGQLNWHRPGTWNDYIDRSGITQRYVVEFSPVPEPSSYALATLGLIGMAGVIRRRTFRGLQSR